MLKVDTSKRGLVRGYIIYFQWRSGYVSLERAKDDECLENGVAYTFWHRHDEDPTIVENELEQLVRCYSKFKDYEGCMMGFEHRDYRK